MTSTPRQSVLVVVRLALGALTMAACGTQAGPSGTGGSATGVVSGRVTAGPTCPVEQVGHPCDPKPVVAEVQATTAGRTVASTHSGADGRYRFELPSGAYTIVVVTQGVLPRCLSRAMTVTTGRTTSGDITCDTGIR